VVGLGNPIRTDDGVGLRVIERLRETSAPSHVTLETAGTCGVGILDLIAGFDRVVLVDAIDAGRPPGAILELTPGDLERFTPLHTVSSHDADLAIALETGRRLDLDLPSQIAIIAIQIADVTTLSERLTPDVEAAIEPAIRTICEHLAGGGSNR
jgi:hydrogenase maturation protease